MDINKVIKSQKMRFKLLELLRFIPDIPMIKFQYRIKTGRSLNFSNPKRFTEKLQWYKVNYRNPLMTKCADKFNVREYVKSYGYEDILIPLYNVYDKAEDIDFNKLPNKFVLKTTNGSHTNIFCDDKAKINEEDIRNTLNNWLKKKAGKSLREWPYYNIIPRIICEQLLEKDENGDLVDYKFICFNGEVSWVFVNSERFSEDGMKFDVYDREFNLMPFRRKGLKSNPVTKPKGYKRMVEIAEVLSSEFPHARIDLYNIDGNIFFGEITFFHGSGYVNFEPDEFDFLLGEKFKIIPN